MRSNRGFTLVETMMTSVVLLFGLVAIGQVFSYTIGANINNQQRTAATILLGEKMEQLKSTPLDDAIWAVGGTLNPSAPEDDFFDYVSIATDGTLIVDNTSTDAPYLRIWQIEGTVPRTVTVIVYAQRAGISRRRMELIRATTMVTSSF